MNLGAKHALGDYLLFMNDDIEVINNEWFIDKNNDKIKIKSGGNKNSIL